MTVKEELHRLIDELPEHDAQRLLSDLRGRGAEDDLPAFLRDAPFDDEPETDEERAAVAEAREEFRLGRVVSHDDIRREFVG